VVLYILTLQSKYVVFTICDPILHENYITGTYKSTIYKKFTQCNTGGCSRAEKESRELVKGSGSRGSATMSPSFCQILILGLAPLLLRTLISKKKFTNIQALKSGMQIQGCQDATHRVLKECQVACTGITCVHEYQWIVYSKQAGSEKQIQMESSVKIFMYACKNCLLYMSYVMCEM